MHGGLNQLRQVTIDLVHAYTIQLVKAAAPQYTDHNSSDIMLPRASKVHARLECIMQN